MNNKGVISMVEGYFTELAFVTFELFRVCKPGACVGIVNDNVRYSGETIPVDLIMTDIASNLGFIPEKIYVLPQRKGNSSQQMGKYGREALRKKHTDLEQARNDVMKSDKQRAWALDQLQKSLFFHQRLHEWKANGRRASK